MVQRKLERIRKLVENMKTGKQDGIFHTGSYSYMYMYMYIMHVHIDLFVVQTMCNHNILSYITGVLFR